MKIEKKVTGLVNGALSQLDNLGYQLDAMGIENRVNRHNLIAFAMFKQKQVEGELDSLSAKYDSTKVAMDSILDTTGQFLKSGLDLALLPARYTVLRLKQQL